MKKRLTLTIVTLLVAGTYGAVLEDWQFNDDPAKSLNAVTNAGTVGTSWNYGGPQAWKGSLRLGDNQYYKYQVNAGDTYRTAAFASPVTTGQVTFQFVVADWDLAGTNGFGTADNGIKIQVGNATEGRMALDFEAASSNDIRVASQSGGLGGSYVENTLGDLNLTNAAPVAIQLLVDLDTGLWSTRVDAGAGWVDLTTDGTGMTSIDEIKLIIQGGASGWEHGGVGGTATEYLNIDSMTLTEGVPVPDPVSIVQTLTASNGNGSGGTNFVDIGTFANAQAGDYVAIMMAANNGNTVGDDMMFAGTATLDTVDVIDNVQANAWYAEVLADGTVSISITNYSSYSVFAAYLVRPADAGLGLDVQSQIVPSGSTPPTNIYTFASASAGLYFEAKGSYNTGAGLPEDPDAIIVQNQYNQGTRVIARGAFENVTAVTNSWTSLSSARLTGLAFTQVAAPLSTPEGLWNEWLDAYSAGMGAETNLQDDADDDLLDNLSEYAFGGEPDNALSQGNTPVQSQAIDGGTNYIEYVYYERDDASDRGLSSMIEVGTDLVMTNWADGSSYEVGSGASGTAGYQAVTNRVPIDAEIQKFIRLQIEFTP
ncbi:hypothetical protein P4B35_19435 [Pontiellaceae bacterium B12227]|nr:hypothetical protein [Pontiellaceae bacterium B12227]